LEIPICLITRIKLLSRFLIALAFVRLAAADAVDVFSTATWSYTNTDGNHGLNFAFSVGSRTSPLTFDLSSIPSNAAILSANLVATQSTDIDFGFNTPNGIGCVPPASPTTFWGEEIGCSQKLDAEYLDQVIVDGQAPGVPQQFFAYAPGTPMPVGPAFITPGGTYSVSISSLASSNFGAFDDFRVATPDIQPFSISGTANAELEVEFQSGISETPEPASYTFLLAALLILLTGLAIYRRRASATRSADGAAFRRGLRRLPGPRGHLPSSADRDSGSGNP
jgi:hypothetical protein